MLIGVTGSFGSGKTTVAKMFAKLGAYVINADELYHSLIKPGKKLYKKIVRQFGKGILKENKAIDRRKLREVVFEDKAKLKCLDSLVHPEVIRNIRQIIKAKSDEVIVVDAPLLVESGFYRHLDTLILVKTQMEKQVTRVKKQGLLTRKEILKRIRMQVPLKKKIALADFIIDNSGSEKQTLSHVHNIWEKLRGGL